MAHSGTSDVTAQRKNRAARSESTKQRKPLRRGLETIAGGLRGFTGVAINHTCQVARTSRVQRNSPRLRCIIHCVVTRKPVSTPGLCRQTPGLPSNLSAFFSFLSLLISLYFVFGRIEVNTSSDARIYGKQQLNIHRLGE